MGMKWVHALAVALTVLLFLVRSRVCAGLVPAKRRSIFCPVCCENLRTAIIAPMNDRSSCCCDRIARRYDCAASAPRYKRDPDIVIDNEDLRDPRDY